MSNPEIYDKWTIFITHTDYAPYFNNTSQPAIKTTKKPCQHKWKITSDDDLYHYKECELCKRKSRQSRIATEKGYNEPNPQKKKQINKWFVEQEYNKGIAVVLDATDLKTSNHLLKSKQFTPQDIIIPEYDTETYEENSKHKILGKCLRNDDYLNVLKTIEPSKLSLIYADFTGSYKKFVEPLLKYLMSVKEELQDNLMLGLTWSDNGAGDKTTRIKIVKKIDRLAGKLNMNEIDESPCQYGYGNGGNMNVVFYKKI